MKLQVFYYFGFTKCVVKRIIPTHTYCILPQISHSALNRLLYVKILEKGDKNFRRNLPFSTINLDTSFETRVFCIHCGCPAPEPVPCNYEGKAFFFHTSLPISTQVKKNYS